MGGGRGGCEQRIEVFVIFFGGGVGSGGGSGGSSWGWGQGRCERGSEVFEKIPPPPTQKKKYIQG